MCALADQIDAEQFTYDPSKWLPPSGVTANSNSLIVSVLSLIGVDVSQHLGGTLPDLGFPGDQTILSGSGDDYLKGFYGNDTFLNSGGGNDILHGWDGISLVRSDLWGGKDTVLYKGYDSVEITAEEKSWSVIKSIGEDNFTDTVYSVESFGSFVFRLLNKIKFAEIQNGITIQDKDDEDLLEVANAFGPEVQSLMTTGIDGIDVEFFNFGTVTATNYADTFVLNKIIGRAFDGGDGTDTADYTAIDGVFVVNMRPDQRIAYLASAPGVTDRLENIEVVLGAQEYNNTFVGSIGDGYSAAPVIFVGGNKADQYAFDLEADRGVTRIMDGGLTGVDQVMISNVAAQNVTMGVNKSVIDGATYLILDFQPFNQSNGNFVLQIAWDRIENIYIDGKTYRAVDIQNKITNNPVLSEFGYEVSQFYNLIYPQQGGTGGSGTGGGVTPTVDPVSGDFTAMKVNPSVSNYYLDYRYADESVHPWVIMSYASASGHMAVTFDTYLKDIQMVSGITWDDIRFTASNTPGNATLTIWIDSLGSSYTIQSFEAGKIIHGMGLYGADMHGYIQDSPNITLNGAGPGQYSASYGWHEDDEGGFQYVGSPMTAHYFVETFSVAGISTINMRTDKLTFKGTAGNDVLYGLDTRDDIIIGYGGNDTLYGYGGNDTLIGGAGRDVLIGGAGDDTYVFDRNFASGTGSGHDIIHENAGQGTDTIRFTDGIEASDVYMWTDMYGYLWFQVGNDADNNTLSVLGSLSSGSVVTHVERVEFDDETVWDLSAGIHIRNNDTARNLFGTAYGDVIEGSAGNDTLYGYGGNDTLIGGAGRDHLVGGAGDDTYIFGWNFASGAGFGYDTIAESADQGTDTIRFTDGIEASDVYMWTDMYGYLWFQVGSDANNNTLAVLGSFSTGSIVPRVERVEFDDETVWDMSAGIHIRNNDTARHLYGTAYGDVIEGGTGNDTLWGYGGNDTLIGGTGRDFLAGGTGDDTYVFGWNFSSGAGFGYDTIGEAAGQGTDTIRFTDGIEASDVYMWTDMYGYLWFQVGNDANNNTLSVQGSFSTGSVVPHVERVEFDDSTVWDMSAGLHIRNNDTARNLFGTAYDDVIEGGTGNDTLYGYGGNDTLIGGGGSDLLIGGAGADTFVFLASDVGNGVDTIAGFNFSDNDKIDLRDMLSGYDPLTDALSDFVQFTNSPWGETIVKVDLDGAGTAYGWTHIASISGHTNLDPDTLAASGHLLAA
jgi:Ca2+-binding RTX toxin-like protein